MPKATESIYCVVTCRHTSRHELLKN